MVLDVFVNKISQTIKFGSIVDSAADNKHSQGYYMVEFLSPPYILRENSDFTARVIGVTLCFYNRSNKKADTYHKRGRGRINIFLASIYHPVGQDDHKWFNEDLESFYNAIPRNDELLSGQDVNSNIGIRSKMFCDVIRPNGIDNKNSKGKYLLFVLNSVKCRVVLT